MADAAIIASGQAYTGKGDKDNFDKFYAIDLQGVELSVFGVAVTESWNHFAHIWLKRYIYFRLNRLINRDLALYLTYMVSAFWHGFYPMYFLAFILYAIFTENHKELHKLCCRYKFMRSPFVLGFIYILANLGLGYLGMMFTILLFRHVKYFVRGLYWIPAIHIILFLLFKLTRKNWLLRINSNHKGEEEGRTTYKGAGNYSIYAESLPNIRNTGQA